MKILCNLGLENYYGEVKLVQYGEKYYLGLENYDQEYFIEISSFLAGCIYGEFKDRDIVDLTYKDIVKQNKS